MKNKPNREQDHPKQLVDLDPETIADLEVDDHDADLLKGGLTTKCPKNDGGGGTIIVA